MSVSVIIPAKNAENSIGQLLDSLFAQRLKPDEVIIVDAGSKDRTNEVIQGYILKGLPIKVISVNQALPGQARNIAINEAAYAIVAMTDADTITDSHWLEKLIKPLEDDESMDLVFGEYRPIMRTYFQKCRAFVSLPSPTKIENEYFYLSSFVSAAIRRHAWTLTSGFPEKMRAGEDIAFFRELKRSKFKIKYVPGAFVYWGMEPNIFSAVKKSFSYTQSRIFWNINTRHLYILSSFYLFLLFSLFISGKISLVILIFVVFFRIIKNAISKPPQLKRLFLNPFSWPVVSYMMFVNDIVITIGSIIGLSKKLFKKNGFE
jgi:glycosyltransferase involved in cell wall biosynthesis